MEEEASKNFGSYLDRTFKVVRQDLFRRFKAEALDITPEQWILLSSLGKDDGQSQADLASHSFKDAPTVSRIMDLLSQKGLITRKRSQGDRRHYRVYLTEAGRDTVSRAWPAVKASRQKGWQHLSEEDYGQFLRIINQIFSNYSEEE